MCNLEIFNVDNVYNNIVVLIEKSKSEVVRQVNTELVLLYWNIGKNIKINILNNNKPEYAKAIIVSLSQKLMLKYGPGFSRANLIV